LELRRSWNLQYRQTVQIHAGIREGFWRWWELGTRVGRRVRTTRPRKASKVGEGKRRRCRARKAGRRIQLLARQGRSAEICECSVAVALEFDFFWLKNGCVVSAAVILHGKSVPKERRMRRRYWPARTYMERRKDRIFSRSRSRTDESLFPTSKCRLRLP
jgi:hypothetical protein